MTETTYCRTVRRTSDMSTSVHDFTPGTLGTHRANDDFLERRVSNQVRPLRRGHSVALAGLLGQHGPDGLGALHSLARASYERDEQESEDECVHEAQHVRRAVAHGREHARRVQQHARAHGKPREVRPKSLTCMI